MTIIKKLALAGTAAALGFATPAIAAPYTAPTASGTATVRLYDAIALLKVADIDFGTVIRDPTWTTGNIVMDSAGATNCAIVAGVSCTGTTSAGHFTIKGDSGSDMSVSLAATAGSFNPLTQTLTLANGASGVDLALSVSGMTQNIDPVTGNGLSSYSVTGTGAATDIKLYGSLAVGDSTVNPNGVYSATFVLTADYK